MGKPICNTPTDARCPGDGVTECKKCPAEHVPPAGGEPEVVATVCGAGWNSKGGTEWMEIGVKTMPLDRHVETGAELIFHEDHRAHVTQLQAEAVDVSKSYEALAHVYAATQKGFEKMQAERDALKAELRKTNLTNQDFVSQIGDLQSELTKALELLKEADNFMYIMTGHDSHARLVHQYGKEWWTPVNELRGKICTALSNQSAPADKGHGGPVGVIVEFGFGLKEVSWTNGKMPDLGTKLYAERPAPVAVATDFKMIGTEPMPPMEYDEP